MPAVRNTMRIWLLGTAVLAVAVAVNARCGSCGADAGDDVCGCKSVLVRPLPLPKVDPAAPTTVCKTVKAVRAFKPVGDVCSCNNVAVRPAYLPRPRSLKDLLGRYQPGTSLPVPAPASMNDFRADAPKIVPDTQDVPVDPVTMNLYFGMQQNAAMSVLEEKLHYGFVRVPTEDTRATYVDAVPEERLYNYEKSVVELKNAPKKPQTPQIEDIVEDLDEEEPKETPSYISYKDLGYEIESGNDAKFVAQQCEGQDGAGDSPQDDAVLEQAGECGGGQVVQLAGRRYLEGAAVTGRGLGTRPLEQGLMMKRLGCNCK